MFSKGSCCYFWYGRGGGLFWSRVIQFGPKRRPGGMDGGGSAASTTGMVPGADHIFNIFKVTDDDSEDVRIESDDSRYPSWLWDLDKPLKSYAEMESMFVHGNSIEEATLYDYKRFQRHHRKLIIKLNNKRLQKKPRSLDFRLTN